MIRRSISQTVDAAQRVQRARRFLTLRSFDVTTEAGRSDERHRRIALTSASGVGSRAIASVTLLVSLPLTVRYLGEERYGLWMTIGSLVSVLGITDLGLGYGLIGRVAEADGRQDREHAAGAVATAFLLLSAVAVAILLVAGAAYPWIDWAALYNVAPGSLAAAEAGPASAVFLVCFALGLPLAVIARFQAGYQDGLVSNVWDAVGHAVSLCALVAAIGLDAGLPWLVLAVSGGPVAVRLVSAAVEFRVRRPWLFPHPRLFSWRSAADLLRIGVWYFVMQVSATVAFSLDNLIIARMGGPAMVATYSVVVRLFGFVITMLSTLQTALWPAYGESITRGDFDWVRRTLFRSVAGTLLTAGPAVVALAAIGPWVVSRFIDPAITPDRSLVAAVAAWSLSVCLASTLGVFLLGAGMVRWQALLTVFMAVASLGAKLLGMGLDGITGLAWAGALAHILVLVIPCLIIASRRIRVLGHAGVPATPHDPRQ